MEDLRCEVVTNGAPVLTVGSGGDVLVLTAREDGAGRNGRWAVGEGATGAAAHEKAVRRLGVRDEDASWLWLPHRGELRCQNRLGPREKGFDWRCMVEEEEEESQGKQG